MLIATFRDTTDWFGRTITYEDEQFILEGHGPILATTIADYDVRGQLDWSSEGLRLWVHEQAARLHPVPPPPPDADPVAPPPPPPPPPDPDADGVPTGEPTTMPSNLVRIATFRAGSGRQGKVIVFDGSGFAIEGEGPTSAVDVMVHDRRQELDWEDGGLRRWVHEAAFGSAPPGAGSGVGSPGIGIAGFVLSLIGVWVLGIILSWIGYAKAKRTGARVGLSLAGIIIGFAWLAIMVVALVAWIPMSTSARDAAREAAVKEGIHSIQIGLQLYAAEHDATYPAASGVNETDLTGYVDNWPKNPYTGGPMTQGADPGQYSYEQKWDLSHTLTGHGKEGDVISVNLPYAGEATLSQSRICADGLKYKQGVTTAKKIAAQLPKGLKSDFSAGATGAPAWTYTFSDGSKLTVAFVVKTTEAGAQELKVDSIVTEDGPPPPDPIVGNWIEADPIDAPGVIVVKSVGNDRFSVQDHGGTIDDLDPGVEHYVVKRITSGEYRRTGRSDFFFRMTAPDAMSTVDTSGGDPLTTEYKRATQRQVDKALAAHTAPEEDPDYPDSHADLTEAEYKRQCATVSFDDLMQSADQPSGLLYRFEGEVYRPEDPTNDLATTTHASTLLMRTDPYSLLDNDQIELLYRGKWKNVHEDDTLIVWGECIGTSVWTTNGLETVSTPVLWVRYYRKTW